MVKHTQTIRRQIGDDLFECVWPFKGLAFKGLKHAMKALSFTTLIAQISIRPEQCNKSKHTRVSMGNVYSSKKQYTVRSTMNSESHEFPLRWRIVLGLHKYIHSNSLKDEFVLRLKKKSNYLPLQEHLRWIYSRKLNHEMKSFKNSGLKNNFNGSWINTWINIVDISIEDLSLNHSGIMAGI